MISLLKDGLAACRAASPVSRDVTDTSKAAIAKMEELLARAKIWRLSSYGWLNAQYADPEFIGHAMWQTDPPIGEELFAWIHSRSSEPAPIATERQQLLGVSGADFEGLMTWARLSIGMMLAEIEHLAGRELADETHIELYRANATIYMSTAADRIREFFIAAVFGVDVNRYRADAKARGKNPGDYRTPFKEALALHESHVRAGETLRQLQPLANRVRSLRGKRNIIIHELATEAAIREREMLREKPQKAANDIDFAELQALVRELRVRRDAERADVIREFSDWYDLLVRVSNGAFEVENALRSRS